MPNTNTPVNLHESNGLFASDKLNYDISEDVKSTNFSNESSSSFGTSLNFESFLKDNLLALSAPITTDSAITNDEVAERRQGFRLGQYHFMIHYHDASEISEMPSVFTVPNAPAWFIGFCNLHGLLIPVFDLKNYFEIEDSLAFPIRTSVGSLDVNRPMLLVLSHHADSMGIIIDGSLQRLVLNEDCTIDNASIPLAIAPVVMHSYQIGQTLWFDLDVTKLLQTIEDALDNPV